MERLPRSLTNAVVFWIIATAIAACVVIVTIPAAFSGQTWPFVVLAVATPIALFCMYQLSRIAGPYRRSLGKRD